MQVKPSDLTKGVNTLQRGTDGIYGSRLGDSICCHNHLQRCSCWELQPTNTSCPEEYIAFISDFLGFFISVFQRLNSNFLWPQIVLIGIGEMA